MAFCSLRIWFAAPPPPPSTFGRRVTYRRADSCGYHHMRRAPHVAVTGTSRKRGVFVILCAQQLVRLPSTSRALRTRFLRPAPPPRRRQGYHPRPILVVNVRPLHDVPPMSLFRSAATLSSLAAVAADWALPPLLHRSSATAAGRATSSLVLFSPLLRSWSVFLFPLLFAPLLSSPPWPSRCLPIPIGFFGTVLDSIWEMKIGTKLP